MTPRTTARRAATLTGLLPLAALSALSGCQAGDEAVDSEKVVAWSGAPLPEHSFTLDVSADALAALRAANDNLQIMVAYYGLPKPGSTARTNELHELAMGQSLWIVDRTSASVTLKGEGVNAALLPETTDGNIYYKISARAVTVSKLPQDILECSIARGTLNKPQTQPKTITCTLPRP